MRHLTAILLTLTLFSACNWDPPTDEMLVAEEFYLNWYGEESTRQIVLSTDGSKTNGIIVVSETICAVGTDGNFILVERPFTNATKYYLIDIRNYRKRWWIEKVVLARRHGNYEVFGFKYQSDFMKKRQELGVPDDFEYNVLDDC